MKHIWFGLLVAMLLVACGKPAEHLAWKQEVPLHDGRVVVLDRLSTIGAKDPFLGNLRMETEQTLAFTHPDTGQRIEWKLPKGLQPYMLDFEGGVPYYVFYAHTVGDYNNWNCPNPPYMVFKYTDEQWRQIAFAELPAPFINRNLFEMAKSNEPYIVNGIATQESLHQYIGTKHPDRKIIGREKVNPIAKGCDDDVLVKQGRQSEIDYRR
jgi:hypothetical protein